MEIEALLWVGLAGGSWPADPPGEHVGECGGLVAQGFVIRVQGFGSDEVLKERIARLLCPVEDHDAPCEVPWGFTLADDTGHQEDVEGPENPDVADLLLAIYTTPDKAADVAERVKTAIGRPVELSVGDPADFDDLATQYRIENA